MKSRKVVIGVDFGTSSLQALQWAARRFAPDAELILAHVIDLPRTPVGSGAVTPALEAAARSFEETRLRETAASLGNRKVRIVARLGLPYDELSHLALETGADLVVVGAHGHRPPSWKMLGTTAERLLRAAAPAVLVVSNPAPHHPRHVLVAVDAGPSTPAVLEWAKDLCDRFDADVTAVHVVDETPVGATKAPDDTARIAAVGADMYDQGTRWLTTLAASGIAADRSDAVVRYGNAGEAILATAAEVDADIVVMGRRGTDTLLPASPGTTVHAVLERARCPVLVVAEEPADLGVNGRE